MSGKKLPNFLRFVLIMFVFQTFAFAAGPGQGLGLTLTGYSLSDSGNHQVHPGYTLTLEAILVNYDSLQYIGPVSFGLSHSNGVDLTRTDDIFNQPHYSGYPIVLNPHDTIPAIFNVHIDPMYFAPGPDVVVVWPIAQVPIVDSISIQILIAADSVSAGINQVNNTVFQYTVQENRILLFNLAAQTNFKQVRIYNLLGQQIYALNADHITEIPVPSVPKGVYLCQIITGDGQSQVIRFVH